ncbi:hypothetical protein MCEMSEM18_02209 [Comamonadaceae bacterium]
MKIEKIKDQIFTYPTRRSVDSDGHSHPGAESQAKMERLTLQADTGDRVMHEPIDPGMWFVNLNNTSLCCDKEHGPALDLADL